jgi:hypoxanthine phosphoribosyltransferase
MIVEDIIDSGATLAYLKRLMNSRGAASVKVCACFDKPSRRKTEISGDYIGFTVEDEFLVGYGLDYAQRYRNVPYVAILKPKIYT